MNSLSVHNDNLNALKLSLCGVGMFLTFEMCME